MRLLYLMFVRLCGWLVLPGNERLHVAQLDLTDLNSVAAFVASWEGPLHVLVNNAGVMASPEEHTAQGWELQFATNHLGHFALAAGLHDAARRRRRGQDRLGQLQGPPALAGDRRRPALRIQARRPVAGLRAVQDR